MNHPVINKKHLSRAERAVFAVLPRSTEILVPKNDPGADLIVNGQPLTIKWAGQGHLGEIRRLLNHSKPRPDIVAATRLSPGARESLTDAGVGWVDDSGAAEIAVGLIVVSRSGALTSPNPQGLERWTPAVLAVAEALLCGIDATVSATQAATGLSSGSCTKALGYLTNLGLLSATAKRGRGSARRIDDARLFLASYTTAAQTIPKPPSIQVGVMWRDPVTGLISAGEQWEASDINWVATSAVAASVMAPFMTNVSGVEAYVDANSRAELESVARSAGLEPIKGGRLTLRPFPSVAVRRMSEVVDGLRVAPWPRVYADLHGLGVRGEEAAEHLAETINGR